MSKQKIEYEVLAQKVTTLMPMHVTVIPGTNCVTEADLSAYEGIYVRRIGVVSEAPAPVVEEPAKKEQEILVDSPTESKLEVVKEEPTPAKPKSRGRGRPRKNTTTTKK